MRLTKRVSWTLEVENIAQLQRIMRVENISNYSDLIKYFIELYEREDLKISSESPVLGPSARETGSKATASAPEGVLVKRK